MNETYFSLDLYRYLSAEIISTANKMGKKFRKYKRRHDDNSDASDSDSSDSLDFDSDSAAPGNSPNGGRRHRRAKLNQWKPRHMEKAFNEYHYKRSKGAKVSITAIAKKYRIPPTTLWKRITGKEEKTSRHLSGGKGKPKILSPGRSRSVSFIFRLCLFHFYFINTSWLFHFAIRYQLLFDLLYFVSCSSF